MLQRYTRWAVVAVLMLAVSSIIGVVVNASIKPDWDYQDDYRYMGGGRAGTSYQAPTVAVAVETVYPPAGEQTFQPPRTPTPEEARGYASTITELIRAQQNYARQREWQYQQAYLGKFDTKRMAEEWIRFGYFEKAGAVLSETTLDTAANVIQRALLAETETAANPAFTTSKVTIETIRFSNSGTDVVLLARHTATVKGVATTWYCRWWMNYSERQWRFHDYELLPSRVRWNAVAAQRQHAENHPTVEYTKMANADLDEILTRAAAAMEGRDYARYPLALADAQTVLIRPLHATQLALIDPVAITPDGPKVQRPLGTVHQVAAATRWVDNPLAWQLLMQRDPDAKVIAARKLDHGPTPSLLAAEAQMLAKEKKTAKAQAILTAGLTAYPGQPLLIAVQFELTAPEGCAAVGERAAGGVDPAECVRQVMDRHGDRSDGLRQFLEGFRNVRPGEATAGLAWGAVLAADKQNPKAAAEELARSLADLPPAERLPATYRFEAWYRNRFAKDTNDPLLLDDPHLGPVLKAVRTRR